MDDASGGAGPLPVRMGRSLMIDAHAHVIAGNTTRYTPSAPAGMIAPANFDDPFDADRLLAAMDASGVEHAILVQRGSIYGFDNSYVCDSAARFPNRFRAVCAIDATRADCGAQVRHWVCERGAVGIRLMELVKGNDISWLDSDTASEVWAAGEELAIPVCVHVFPWNRVEGLTRLARILGDFPRITVVVDHLGAIRSEVGPPDHGVDELLETIAGFEGANIKFTTIPLGRLDAANIETSPVLHRVMKLFGAERMLWGSDITQSQGSYDYMVGLARNAVAELPSSQQEQLLGRTAARIYRVV